MIKHSVIFIMLLFSFLLSSCSSSRIPPLEKESVEIPIPTSAVTPISTSTPLIPLSTPTKEPIAVHIITVINPKTNLTESVNLFESIYNTLGFELPIVEYIEGVNALFVYNHDRTMCFYSILQRENFPEINSHTQSDKYLLEMVGAVNVTPSEGDWMFALFDSSLLTVDDQDQIKELIINNIDSWGETCALNRIIDFPKRLDGYWIVDIVPLSNEQVDLLYHSDLINSEL